MEKINEDNEDFDKIKIFSSDDDKLKILGELLSNKSSRDIIKLLIGKEMYINEIAKKLELKVSLVIHHLQKMEAIGLLEITNKNIARKGDMHRFFKIPSGMLIFPKQSEEEVNNGVLKKFFKEGIKYSFLISIGIFSLSLIKKYEKFTSQFQFSEDIPLWIKYLDLETSVIVSVLVALGIILIIKKRKKGLKT